MCEFITSKFVEDVQQYLQLEAELKRDYSPYKYGMKKKLEESIRKQIQKFNANKNQRELKWQDQKKQA